MAVLGIYHFVSFTLGLKDVDCEDNQLCCFDGCINACYMAGRGNEKKLEYVFLLLLLLHLLLLLLAYISYKLITRYD